MKKNPCLRNRILSLVAISILLIQSAFAAGLSDSYNKEEASKLSHQTEVIQEVAPNTRFTLADGRITFPAFVDFDVVKVFPIDIPLIVYQNCQEFFVNPHFFHSFYNCLSALAP